MSDDVHDDLDELVYALNTEEMSGSIFQPQWGSDRSGSPVAGVWMSAASAKALLAYYRRHVAEGHEAQSGLQRVRDAIRRDRGGDAPVQVQGFA